MKLKHYLSIVSRSLLVAGLLVVGTTLSAQTYTIDFSAHPPPAVTDPSLDQNDQPPFGGAPGNSIETGVRFRVTQPGTITGIRFLKGQGVAGTHIGHLWTNTGTQLAQATFTETASGWQEVAVSVHINSGITFLASVFSSIGDYAAEPLGSYNWNVNGPPPNDAPNDFGAPPIKVIRATNDPAGNGVYDYLDRTVTPNGAFPTSGGTSGVNYWIDVRFQPDFSLPVSLSDFKATATASDVVLDWKTEHEYYNKGFEIQRSNNGADWYAVNFVDGANESNVTRNYAYTDKSLAPGKYFYRLKQIDLDGRNSFSSTVTAVVGGKGKVSLFQNYPNPFTGVTTIRFDLPSTQKARLSILDMSGREIRILTDNTAEAGSHLVKLNSSGLPPQSYIVRLQTEEGILTRKIVVQ